MTLLDFENQVANAAIASSICDIPRVVRLSSTAIKLRVEITSGDFIDAFYNEETNTTAYALIRQGQRVFGADNTGDGIFIHLPILIYMNIYRGLFLLLNLWLRSNVIIAKM